MRAAGRLGVIPALGVMTVIAGCGGSSGGHPGGAPATATVLATPTTATPTTGPSTAPSGSTTASPGTSGSVAANVVTGAGSTLTTPAAPTTKRANRNEDGCYGLLDAHFRYGSCERYTSKLGTAVALVEYQGKQGRDLVYTLHGTTATLALRRVRTLTTEADGNPDLSSLVTVDLVDDNTPKAIFEVPASSSGDQTSYNDLDVVEASGQVVVHLDLHDGVARKAFGGGLETYTPAAAGKAIRWIYRFSGGAWRVAARRRIDSDQVPDNVSF